MHTILKNLELVKNEIKEIVDGKQLKSNPEIIAVSKTFPLSKIAPIIDNGHIHFGENKVQEAKKKWTVIKKEKNKLNLHFVGKLQTNKAKDVVNLFDYVHSLENVRQAEVLSKHERELKKKLNYLIQINIGNEKQKSGIDSADVKSFLEICKSKYDLNVVGFMCLPPNVKSPEKYFKEILDLKSSLPNVYQNQMTELSMGMSNDYITAIYYRSTFLRIGTKIFGERK